MLHHNLGGEGKEGRRRRVKKEAWKAGMLCCGLRTSRRMALPSEVMTMPPMGSMSIWCGAKERGAREGNRWMREADEPFKPAIEVDRP